MKRKNLISVGILAFLVSTILMEEMPAYFLGQKDLDSVTAIAQDRVQKILDERG